RARGRRRGGTGAWGRGGDAPPATATSSPTRVRRHRRRTPRAPIWGTSARERPVAALASVFASGQSATGGRARSPRRPPVPFGQPLGARPRPEGQKQPPHEDDRAQEAVLVPAPPRRADLQQKRGV